MRGHVGSVSLHCFAWFKFKRQAKVQATVGPDPSQGPRTGQGPVQTGHVLRWTGPTIYCSSTGVAGPTKRSSYKSSRGVADDGTREHSRHRIYIGHLPRCERGCHPTLAGSSSGRAAEKQETNDESSQ